MSVTATPLPSVSVLHAFVDADDFLDCYAVRSDLSVREAAEKALTFPGWVQLLMRLRNILVAPFGLHTESPRPSNSVGLFPVESESADELIAGFDDRHLNFRISILSHDGKIHMATWVRPHNFGGRAYLALVMPFHVLIVRNALARAAHSA